MKKIIKLGVVVLTVYLTFLRITEELFKSHPKKCNDVYWWIDFDKIEPKLRQDIKRTINATLNNPFGWSACGLRFKYTQLKAFANIKIYTLKPTSTFRNSRTIGVTTCNPLLPKTTTVKILHPDKFKFPYNFYVTVNHEIGHCLFYLIISRFPYSNKHSINPQDLMHWREEDNQNVMPSAKILEMFRQHTTQTARRAVLNLRFLKIPTIIW